MSVDELTPLLNPPVTAADRQAAQAAADRWGIPPHQRFPGPIGRLGQVLTWWASVRGDRRTTPPQSVVLCRAPAPDTRPAPDPALLAATTTSAATGTVSTVIVPDHLNVVDAARWGSERGDIWADEGIDLVLLSLDDPVPTRVLAARLLAVDAITANDWPQDTGIDDRTWMRRTAQIRDGLRRLRDTPRQTAPIVATLGSPTIAAASTLLLRCSARRTPVLVDGPGAAAVALLARTASPAAATWWQAAHRAGPALHTRLLTAAHLDPLLDLGIEVEDGTGALAALTLLEFALRLPPVAEEPGDQPERGGTP